MAYELKILHNQNNTRLALAIGALPVSKTGRWACRVRRSVMKAGFPMWICPLGDKPSVRQDGQWTVLTFKRKRTALQVEADLQKICAVGCAWMIGRGYSDHAFVLTTKVV